MNILFYGTKKYDEEFFDAILPEYPELSIHYLEANLSPETAALAAGYEAICAFVNANIGAKTVEQLHRQGVKLILMRCAGYNNVDLKKTAEYGIKVARVPGYSPEAVAEHAMALALTANRHTHKAYIKCRENDFSLNGLMGMNFHEKTAGIVGTGKIGAAMSRICHGFGMKVIAYDVYKNPSLDFVEYVSFEELLAKSDLISLHCPLFPSTEGMINKESIAKMKDGVILINTSRGPLVVEKDLAEAMQCGKVYAAGCDVVSTEPIQADNPLLGCYNTILTPHIAWAPKESRQRLMDIAVDNLKHFVDGTPQNVVNQ